jgi:hypothetical protein
MDTHFNAAPYVATVHFTRQIPFRQVATLNIDRRQMTEKECKLVCVVPQNHKLTI